MRNAFSFISDIFPQERRTRICLAIGLLGLVFGLVLVILPVQQNESSVRFTIRESPRVGEKRTVIPPQSSSVPSIEPKIAAQASNQHLVSINKATRDDLESLPLIGAKKAEQIIQLRPYPSLDVFFQRLKMSKSQQNQLAKLIAL